MLDNLRATQWPNGEVNHPMILAESSSSSNTNAYYYYPNNDVNIVDAHPEYGLIYNWQAATRLQNPSVEDQHGTIVTTIPQIQGICPNGWHLPQLKEWTALVNTVSRDYCQYTTYRADLPSNIPVGIGFKSEIPVNNTPTNGYSRSYEEGGFNALLVGYKSATWNPYGTQAIFHSSNAYDTTTAYCRNLDSAQEWFGTSRYQRSSFLSIRCVKD